MRGPVIWQVAVSFENMLKKCLQGSTLSGHRMTTGFGPFEFVKKKSGTKLQKQEEG